MTAYDELQLDTLGDKKTALFLIMSDTDATFNFLISMIYTQLFNLLCEKADDVYGGRLPVHVRCLIDEMANIGQIPNLEKLVATIRSREISACLVLQAQSQLKAIYKDNADTIIGNMDSRIFLGGSEPTTLKELNQALGKETIDTYNTSNTRGNSPSYGLNYQKLGKDLASVDELAVLDADSEAKKKELFAKVRTGQVRVLMGSTQKMGAGTNCQDRLVALHHLDVGWRPSDMTQRNGRIIRQGNQNKEVQIYQYVTEGTFDAYLYQTLENKQKFISQIMTSKSPVRSCDDVDEQALSYAEIKALCAGNPLIKEKMDLDIDVARLKVLKADHQSQQYRMEDKLLKYFPAEIERQTGYIRGFEADIQTVTTHPQIVEGFCGMEILGKHYMEKEDAGEMILAACKEMKATEPIPLGSYRGFQMELSFDSFRHDFDITLKGAVSHRVSLGTDARGNIIRLDNALSSIPEKLEKAHEQLTNLQNQQEATRAELGKPFPQEAELAEKSARLAELDAALNMEDSMPEREEAEQADKPSVLADLKAKSEHIPPYRASGGREEVL